MSERGQEQKVTNPQAIRIHYTNWKGERGWRTIIPYEGGLHFGSNEWHKEPQWLLNAFDVDKQADRTFALLGIHGADYAVRPHYDCTCHCAPNEHGSQGCNAWYGDRNTGHGCDCMWDGKSKKPAGAQTAS